MVERLSILKEIHSSENCVEFGKKSCKQTKEQKQQQQQQQKQKRKQQTNKNKTKQTTIGPCILCTKLD